MPVKSLMKILFVFCFLVVSRHSPGQQLKPGTIDRKKVIHRHNFHITDLKEPGPTQVGNGNFAYGFDITGMQTLHNRFTTMSQWSWHSVPLPNGLCADDFKQTNLDVNGRMRPYELENPNQPALSAWLAGNPHRFNLGRIGLWLKDENGMDRNIDSIQNADQYFDLWSAIAVSNFNIQGYPVKVITIGDPYKDIVAFKIVSPLIAAKRLGVFIEFPYANLEGFSNGADYSQPGKHETLLVPEGKNKASLKRLMDSTRYQVSVQWKGNGKVEKERAHRYLFTPLRGNEVEYVFSFNPSLSVSPLPSFDEVQIHAKKYWPRFWKSGGAVDLSSSRDKRWMELERRIVLSQYNMKINASGKYPPQETGLVNNSWYGRFHYEMIWWHNAHYALWNRWSLLNPSLDVYRDNLEAAKQRAAAQGYAGARYPKCTGPDGKEWPHPIHAFLVWQQPHPIFFADLNYRAHPSKATLDKWAGIVDASADFLASYASFDSIRKQYLLGPPISFVPENNDYYKDKNPAFELGYWRYALRTAQSWRKKQKLIEKAIWNKVYDQLSPIPIRDSIYVQWEDAADMWTKLNYEHPALLGIYGMLPGDGVNKTVMKRTLHKVVDVWKFDQVWGWDFPLAAMAAARLNEPKMAIDFLLYPSPKNHFDKHGFVGGGNPYPYFPTNGGLLYATAMMAAGWDNDRNIHQPGFPKDGSWVIKWEGLKKAP